MKDEPTSGYRPLKLTLTGFRGIRSGLGRDTLTLDLEQLSADAALIAIGGANGRGKTTVIENLQPYLVMPSRAGADGLGAFSYYDQVYLPESQKELIWRHQGRLYKTQLVFRVNGKRKTEAYLFEQAGADWTPVTLADGSASDGKVDSYERAVTEVLGPAQTFFSSVFSAQGKRPMSAYRNGEIKSLLADLLGLDEVRAQGAKAAETTRLLKTGLSVIRLEQAQSEQTRERLESERQAIGDAEAALTAARAERSVAASALEQAREHLTKVDAMQQAARANEKRRAELNQEQARLEQEAGRDSRRIEEEVVRLNKALRVRSIQRMQMRQRQHGERRRQLLQQRAAHHTTAALARQVGHAQRWQDTAARVVEARKARVAAAQAETAQGDRLRSQVQSQHDSVDAIDREAGQLALRQTDLSRRFGLTQAVPCAGMGLQQRCSLLGDARSAQALLPSVDTQMRALAEKKAAAQAAIRDAEPELKRIADAAGCRERAEQKLEASSSRWLSLRQSAARSGEVRQAEAAIRAIDEELALLGENAPAMTKEEAAEQSEIAAGQGRAQAEHERLARQLAQSVSRHRAGFERAATGFRRASGQTAQAACASATQSLREAQERETAAVRRSEQGLALQQQIARAAEAKRLADARAASVERELGAWTLLAKCLSNDGVIALDIDDAGPTLAALANDLLSGLLWREVHLGAGDAIGDGQGRVARRLRHHRA